MKNLFLLLFVFPGFVLAKSFQSNSVNVINAPDWLSETMVRKTADRIQNKLEWTTQRVNMTFYTDKTEFAKAHGLGAQAVAVTQSSGDIQRILMGPRINKDNFHEVFGHELVHVIFRQKYKGVIPKWLEEGLANFFARKNQEPNYKFIASRELPSDVRDIVHLYSSDPGSVRYHYQVSLALAKMISRKCDMENLLRLSVEYKLEKNLKNICAIDDINQAFRDWIKKKSNS